MKAASLAARKRHADRHAPAIICVAKKMPAITWHMLMAMTHYESRSEDLCRRKLAKLGKAGRN